MAQDTPQYKENLAYFHRTFNNLMKSHRIKQIDIINATNIPKTTLNGYARGTSLPNLGNIQKIADFFNIKKSDIDIRFSTDSERIEKLKTVGLYEETVLDRIIATTKRLHEPRQKKVLTFAQDQLDEQEGNSINNILSYSDFTCYGAVSAGTGEWLGEEYKEEVTLPASIVPNQAFDFVLRVNGNSMEPLFKDDEYIFVRKTEDIRNGQIGVFVVDGEAYLKKAYLEKDCLRLVSLNKDYEDLLFNGQNDIKLVGVVVI